MEQWQAMPESITWQLGLVVASSAIEALLRHRACGSVVLLLLVSSCRLAGPHGHWHSFRAFPCVTNAVLHSRGIARAVF